MSRRLLPALFLVAYAHCAPAVTFVVTNTADEGPGSLRQAILDANATPGPDLIHFSIATGPQTIAPLSALPIITDTVDINGATQPGYSNAPVIQLSGSSAGAAAAGLQLETTESAIIGLHIEGFGNGAGITINGGGQHVLVGNFVGALVRSVNAHGIVISNSVENQIGLSGPNGPNVISYNLGYGILFAGSSSNVVEANFIGTDAGGVIALGNQLDGIALLAGSSHNSIGGMAPGAGNVISGNGANGIYLSQSPFNTIEGNYIGCDATGTASIPNQLRGINVFNSSDLTIGGGAAAARNVISGNGAQGIEIAGVGSSNTVVQGNYIGVDATGLAALPNRGSGIFLPQSAEVQIGGREPGLGNVISGNAAYGIVMVHASRSVVQGNLVGLDRSGGAILRNGVDGVLLSDSRENLIGGAEPDARNIISGNQMAGIHLTGEAATGNSIEGNFIGTTLSGDAAAPNGEGIRLLSAPDNTIQSNVISGNAATGLHVSANSNVVVGNFIGVDASGSKAVPNGGNGIFMSYDGSTIGGTEPELRNVISGNGGHGIQLNVLAPIPAPAGASDNVIQGNYIGLNAAGTAAIGNRGFGIAIGAARETTIGGSEAGGRNVISGNAGGGVSFVSGASTNALHGNFIGTDYSGSFGVPNGGPGVLLTSSARHNFIGGTEPGEGNIIAFNTGDGVLGQSNAIGNMIQGNSIHSNGKLGINLKPASEAVGVVTPNDPGDLDTGPNNLQNYPVITNVVYLSSRTIIQGYLRSSTNGSFSIDFYANTATEQTGYGEGQFYLGNEDVDTDENGLARFAFSASNAFSNQFFTATALNYDTGDTSEFSAAMGGLRITSIRRADGSVEVRFTTVNGRRYHLERATGLGVSWTPVTTPTSIVGTGGEVPVFDSAPSAGHRLYRAVLLPQ